MPTTPVIPDTITVHLGRPNDSAERATVNFTDYIKNVASSELYPTWPESCLKANIHAIISFALNRIYTDHYRSRGYDFDITNSAGHDQMFVKGRDVYNNISEIVDEVFNDYLVRNGQIQPLYAQYCGRSAAKCPGFSQWGTVSLAQKGMESYQILQKYFGNDISMIFNAPTSDSVETYPGSPMCKGDRGVNIKKVQMQLNKIAENYPAIPRIKAESGKYDSDMEAAVRKFQQIFNLKDDGTINKATWYKIKSIYNAIKKFSNLYSKSPGLRNNSRQGMIVFRFGSIGEPVKILQFCFNFINRFNPNIPNLAADGYYGHLTEHTVKAFQREYGLKENGIVGPDTWLMMNKVYRSMLDSMPDDYKRYSPQYYPGYFLTEGLQGDAVRNLQTFLHTIAESDDRIPPVEADGVFGKQTRDAVIAIQKSENLGQTGEVGPMTWNCIIRLYNEYR